MTMGIMASSAAVAAPSPKASAAGRPRLAVDDMRSVGQQRPGQRFEATDGLSGKLRQRIEHGEPVAVRVSTSIKHTDAAKAAGTREDSVPFTRNVLRLIAAPGRHVTSETAVVAIVELPARLGTSTPTADPSGDYTWQTFGAADVFISCCTNAVATAKVAPGLTRARLPDASNVGARYRLGVAAGTQRAAAAR